MGAYWFALSRFGLDVLFLLAGVVVLLDVLLLMVVYLELGLELFVFDLDDFESPA